jgi:hypothetical protein
MRDIAAKPIVRTGIVIALVVAGVAAIMLALLHAMGIPPGGERFDAPYTAPGAPGLSSAPQPELQKDRGEKEARLHSAGWVDRDAGIAHIPIDDAMDILASRAEGQQ